MDVSETTSIVTTNWVDGISIRLSVTLSRLDVRSLFRATAVCRAWYREGLRPETWETFVIWAEREPLLERGRAGSQYTYPVEGNNIWCFGEEGIFRVAARLVEAARSFSTFCEAIDADVGTMPRHPTVVILDTLTDVGKPPAGVSRSADGGSGSGGIEKAAWVRKPSQMEVCKYRFGINNFWFFQYNTGSFGWFDHTVGVPLGLRIWAPCLVLCEFFSSPEAPPVRGRRCLEIGAGSGIMGSVLGALGAEAVVTDVDEMCLCIARVNARMNGLSATACSAHRLEYGAEDGARFRAEHGEFDILVGADVLYVDRAAALIFESADVLLTTWGSFYLGVVHRHAHVVKAMRQAASEAGFTWEILREPFGTSSDQLLHSSASEERLRKPSVLDGMRGSLLDFQRELNRVQATVKSVGVECAGRVGAFKETKERVQLYRFVRRGALHLDTLD
eukprot:TRINITY_DN25092_c0_g1_i1.p1 TRINITY_DN25092_c0_g1~~TRINITY_DN25092_c0_g1_i1.p1  ORF type:complete len:447 (+),score=76.02 TRINITY_DN25092_c0_g1_i1:282-1622(+)